MRFKLLDGCSGVTLAGLELTPGKDGTVEAEPASAADLAPHGIVPVEANEPKGSSTDDRRTPR